MLNKNIEFELTPKSIDKAIKDLRQYENEVVKRATELRDTLLKLGANIVRGNILRLDVWDSGELYNSVDVFYSEENNAGFIKVACNYALFVEFGTGIVGKTQPYEDTAGLMARVGYRYGGGTNYVVLSDGRIGWFFPSDDGKWYFTEGMPSRPFVFESLQDLNRVFTRHAKAVFE